MSVGTLPDTDGAGAGRRDSFVCHNTFYAIALLKQKCVLTGLRQEDMISRSEERADVFLELENNNHSVLCSCFATTLSLS